MRSYATLLFIIVLINTARYAGDVRPSVRVDLRFTTRRPGGVRVEGTHGGELRERASVERTKGERRSKSVQRGRS